MNRVRGQQREQNRLGVAVCIVNFLDPSLETSYLSFFLFFSKLIELDPNRNLAQCVAATLI